MELLNEATGEKKYKHAFRGFCKDAATLNTLKHDTIREMVLRHNPATIPITRPNLKRTIGHISTEYQTKVYQPVSKKRATRGVMENEIKVPYGY